MMKNSGCCYGYARVSTAIQTTEGHSLEEQEKKIRAWAELNNMKLMGMYIDAGVSGTFMFERPEFSRLMKDIDRGDVLVAYDISRVSRNSKDMTDLMHIMKKMGASAYFIKDGFNTSTTMGKAMAQVASIFKEIEAAYTSERTREAYQENKQAGRASGRPPYGWKKIDYSPGSGLIEDPEQQRIISLIRRLRDEDKMSFNAIANKLTTDEIPTPTKGHYWNSQSVTLIYRRRDVATKGRHDK